MAKLKTIFRRLRKRSRNGHWLIHLCLVAFVVALWLIPLDTFTHEVNEFGAKVGLISGLIRALAEDLTVTAKSMGTLATALIGLAYIIYNRRKPE